MVFFAISRLINGCVQGYGEALRGYFASKTNPIMLVDFAGIKIFDAITVEANILLSQKAANIFNTQACLVQDSNGLNNLSDFVQQQGVKCNFADSIPWVILSPIEQSIKQKIESVGIPLKDWNIQINYGIKTGFNDAFIISTEKRDEILANCQTEDERVRTAELIRPYFSTLCHTAGNCLDASNISLSKWLTISSKVFVRPLNLKE